MKRIVSVLIAVVMLFGFTMPGISVYAEGETFDINGAEVVTNYESYEYRFKEVKPSVKVFVIKDGTREKLKINRDYTVAYSNNINVGTAGITVTGIGNYSGTAEGSFEISPLDIGEKGFSVNQIKAAYVGLEPVYELAYEGQSIVKGTDYTVTASGYDKAGVKSATVTIKGIGNLGGTRSFKTNVYPNKVTGIKLKKKKATSVRISWNSLKNTGVTGYKVYEVDKKGNILKTVADVKTNSAIITDLEKGKVFRFRIKAYKKQNGKAVFSNISSKVTTYTKPAKVTANFACRSSKYKIYVGWDSMNCSGFQIKYSTNKKFKSNVGLAYAKGSKTSKKIVVDKANTTYYVKVRAYTTYKGKKKFGKWSEKFSTDFGKLYEYYSTYYVNNPNRTTNLKLACKAIDGTIVYPGDVFSFNETVGIRTAAKGYKPAPIFTGPTGHEDGVGGGVCQVASTMFNAALYCNFSIVERHQHSQRVTYCPLGRDAAIFWGSEDFKFRNTSEFPIKISMECSGGKLTCSIYTNGYKNPPKVTLDVSRSGNHFTLCRYVKGKVNYTTSSNY